MPTSNSDYTTTTRPARHSSFSPKTRQKEERDGSNRTRQTQWNASHKCQPATLGLFLSSPSLYARRDPIRTLYNIQPKRNFVQKTVARSKERGDRSRRRRPKVRVTTPTTNYELRTTNHGLRTTNHEPRTADYGLRITDHGSRTTDHGLRITDHGPWRDDLASLPSSPDHSYPLVRFRRLSICNPAVVVYSLFPYLFPSALYTSIIKPKRSPSNQSFQFNFLVNGTDRLIDQRVDRRTFR